MTDRLTVTLLDAQRGHSAWVSLWMQCKALLMAGHRLVVTVRRETRSTAQNALMWSCLSDLSQQLEWAVDGQMVRLEPEEVKDVLTAGLKKHQRMARGIDGGLVILGQRTSRMTVAEMAELITLAHAYGDQQGVRWSRTSLGRDVPDEAFEVTA